MESGANLNCWFKSVFFVLGYPQILDLFFSRYTKTPLDNLSNSLFEKIKENNVYNSLKNDKEIYNIFCRILSETELFKQLVYGFQRSEFMINLDESITCQDLPYFELYVINFLKYGCGLKVLDLLYLESSRQNENIPSEYEDDVYCFFHEFYNYNDRLIFSDEEKKEKIAQQTFDETYQEKDKILDIVVVSHHKYNSKLTRYFTELSKVRDNKLFKYKDKQSENINKKLLLLNISRDYKDPPRYYNVTKSWDTVIKTTHIFRPDIDLNKEFLLFGCLLRNNNTTYTRTKDGKIKKGQTKTIFAYLTYDTTPEYKSEIKADDIETSVTVSYTIKSQHYIDDTKTKDEKIVNIEWITRLCRFANKTFKITENDIDYEYNFATGDKLLLYMNVFNFIDKEKLFYEIDSDIAKKFPDNRIPITTISKLHRSAVTYNIETDTTSDSVRSNSSSKSRKTTARNYSPNNNSRSTNSRSRSISN